MQRYRYVLDESVVKGAATGCQSSLKAIIAIVERCHCIVFDDQWVRSCIDWLSRHAHSARCYALLGLFQQAWIRKGKMHQQIAPSPPLPSENEIHHKDLWLVRLAVASGAKLVTKDGPLAETLRKKSIPCVGPEDFS